MACKMLLPGWPAARPLGVCFQIMFEAWTDESAPSVGPMCNTLKPGKLDTP